MLLVQYAKFGIEIEIEIDEVVRIIRSICIDGKYFKMFFNSLFRGIVSLTCKTLSNCSSWLFFSCLLVLSLSFLMHVDKDVCFKLHILI